MALGGAALEWDLEIGSGKGKARACREPASSQLKCFGVGAPGYALRPLPKKSGKWVMHGTVLLPARKQTHVRTVITFEDHGDTHVNEYPSHKDMFMRVKNQLAGRRSCSARTSRMRGGRAHCVNVSMTFIFS